MTRIILDESHYITDRGFVFINGAIRESELENAPPIGWLPDCFMANTSDRDKCAFLHRSIEGHMNEACTKCPFRK